ncbi:MULTISPECIES: hypothetical protein [unclassified Leisingera]|uniref:hypothetical protein n=1 Tax=unclassified Leisingera TaxID=2614906 RepID=UPI0010115AEB|nr:hypothetical protein [Leisingera sp. NJS204]MCF6432668.1 hypothetical protein [Leisingera sp. MMG026]QAX28133.1 hypothetical protein ETW24_01155 [Leisingera sp. NJS204]
MAESLLSFSEVLLFGRLIDDMKIVPKIAGAVVGTVGNLQKLEGTKVNGETVAAGDKVLVMGQNNKGENGLYEVGSGSENPWIHQRQFPKGTLLEIAHGPRQGLWRQVGDYGAGQQDYEKAGKRRQKGQGRNNLLGDQLSDDANLARIYGFSYEGTYFELPEPVIFLVHGDGESATGQQSPAGQVQVSRAPLDPSVTGVASAEYQIANDIRVWDYDKADYTIRMDVMTGMLEQVLLDVFFGDGGPSVSGAKVSGAKVSGAKVSGAKVSGAKVSGAKARGSGD